jgi:drug/metabolite transporter (DMT)-like permease
VTISAKEQAMHKAGAANVRARLLLILLCLIWGTTWPAMKISLNEIPPLSMRTLTAALGAVVLPLICIFRRRSLRVPNARAWAHIVAASFLNIIAFSLCSAFAQIAAATSRVAILTYTLPIWALLFAWAVLGERPNRVQWIAVALCIVGIAILVGPLATTGIPLGLALAVGGGASWAAGTVYLKWARIEADPLGAASWQMIIAFFVIAGCLLFFDGPLDLHAARADGMLAVLYSGAIGNAVAYAVWFDLVQQLPAGTVSLGILGIPVIGVTSSVLILGDRPTPTDLIGFAFTFAASACIVLTPQGVRTDASQRTS